VGILNFTLPAPYNCEAICSGSFWILPALTICEANCLGRFAFCPIPLKGIGQPSPVPLKDTGFPKNSLVVLG